MKRVATMALGIGIGALVLTGCGDTAPDGVAQGTGDPSAPGYSALRQKDAISIAHHYPKDACDYVASDSRFTAFYSQAKEYHCEDYGRVDDGINCGEDDYRYKAGGTTYLSECIVGADGMQAGKKVDEVDSTSSIQKIFSDLL